MIFIFQTLQRAAEENCRSSEVVAKTYYCEREGVLQWFNLLIAAAGSQHMTARKRELKIPVNQSPSQAPDMELFL